MGKAEVRRKQLFKRPGQLFVEGILAKAANDDSNGVASHEILRKNRSAKLIRGLIERSIMQTSEILLAGLGGFTVRRRPAIRLIALTLI
jgi:hypothetical protein